MWPFSTIKKLRLQLESQERFISEMYERDKAHQRDYAVVRMALIDVISDMKNGGLCCDTESRDNAVRVLNNTARVLSPGSEL
jgi:hypothetical protein